MVQITEKDFKKLTIELNRAFYGLSDYAETLECIDVCEVHLMKMHDILEKYMKKNKGE